MNCNCAPIKTLEDPLGLILRFYQIFAPETSIFHGLGVGFLAPPSYTHHFLSFICDYMLVYTLRSKKKPNRKEFEVCKVTIPT